jgi:hypothetical protein
LQLVHLLHHLLHPQPALVRDSDLNADAEVLQQHRAELDMEAAALRKIDTAGVLQPC